MKNVIMKSTGQISLGDAEQNKKKSIIQIEPAALDVDINTTEPEPQSIVTAAYEINNAAANKKKGYREGNKNDSDTGNLEEK